jgi:propionate CoA-transferase
MAFRPIVPDNIRSMDARIFLDEPMGLKDRSPMSLNERLQYDSEKNVLYVNFEGMSLETEEDASELADFLDESLASCGRKVRVIVNYDNFHLSPRAADRFYKMVRHNEENYFLSSIRYSTDAFFRHQLGEDFARADLEQRIYRDFDEARENLRLTDL